MNSFVFRYKFTSYTPDRRLCERRHRNGTTRFLWRRSYEAHEMAARGFEGISGDPGERLVTENCVGYRYQNWSIGGQWQDAILNQKLVKDQPSSSLRVTVTSALASLLLHPWDQRTVGDRYHTTQAKRRPWSVFSNVFDHWHVRRGDQ